MPYVLNGADLRPDVPFSVGETRYSGAELSLWSHADLLALGLTWIDPISPRPTVEDLCALVDAERDRRLALDFAYDFGATPALNDAQEQIEAGVRRLQMSPQDRTNWQTLQGAALTAVISGAPATPMPMRAEDNWNVQTTAAQVLQVLAAMTAERSPTLFFAGALKSRLRSAADPHAIDRDSGWPD